MANISTWHSEEPVTASTNSVEHVYRTHGQWLVAFLRRRVGAQDAEDLAQETYARVARANIVAHSPKALLARVALSAAADLARRRATRPNIVCEPDHETAGVLGGQAEALLLKQIILKLPPRLREVFLLSRFGGLTYEEIARRCNISVKTVEARMTKALAMCTAHLDGRGGPG